MVENSLAFVGKPVEEYKCQEIIESGQPVSRDTLLNYLSRVRSYLDLTKGTKLAIGQEIVPPWFDWWFDFLKKLHPDHMHGKIVPYHNIHELSKNTNNSGMLVVAGMEVVGHKAGVDWMLLNVDNPVLVIESVNYLKPKKSGRLTLNPVAELSMWAHYDPRLIIAVKPW